MTIPAAPSPAKKLVVPTWALVAFAVAATLGVRLATLGRQNLWLDELTTAWVIDLDFAGLIRDRLAEAHSPLYFLLLKIFGLDGASDFLLRLPSAVFDALAAGVMALAARRITGPFGAFVMGLLYAFTPLLVQYGQEARPYAMENLFFALALLAAVTLTRAPRATVRAFSRRTFTRSAAAKRGSRRLRVAAAGFVLAMVAAGWTLPVGWIAVAALQASILVQPVLLRSRSFVRLWLGLSAITWVAILPLILALAPAISGDVGTYWTSEFLPFRLSTIWTTFGLVFASVTPGDSDRFLGGLFAFIGPILVVAMVLTAAIARRRRPQVRRVAWLLVAITAAILVLSAVQSLVVARYFMTALIAYLLLAATGATIWWRHAAPSMMLLAAVAGLVLQGFDSAAATHKVDWAPVITLMTTDRQPIAAVVTRGELGAMLRRYVPTGITVTTEVAPADGSMAAAVLPVLHRGDTAWALSERTAPNLTGLPATTVICTWQHENYWVAAVAPNRRALPAAIQACIPENGPLLERR